MKKIYLTEKDFEYGGDFNELIPYIAKYNYISITENMVVRLCKCIDFIENPNCKIRNDDTLEFLGFTIYIKRDKEE